MLQNVQVWPNSIIRAVLFIWLTIEEGAWGNCQEKESTLFSALGAIRN